MSTTTQFRIGPEKTPPPILKLIIWTCSVCLGSALLNNWIQVFFGIPGPQSLLTLSWWGISNYLLWQPFTHLFVQWTGGYGITMFFLLGLVLQMYILWFMGSMVHENIGTKPFLKLYFFSGIIAGLITLLLMPIFGQYAILAGPTASILAIFIVWTMLYPELELLLFFLIPVQAKWILAGSFAALLLMSLSQLDFIHLTHYFTAALFTYIYAVVAWNLKSPWPFMRPADRVLARIGDYFREKKAKAKEIRNFVAEKTKILDINTGEPNLDNDDSFIDAMLAKISRYGEKSLTWKEKKRMQQISEKKQKEKFKKNKK